VGKPENFFSEHWILVISLISIIAYTSCAVSKDKFKRELYLDILVVFLTTASLLTGISLTIKIMLNHQDLLKSANLEEIDIGYFLIGGGLISWNAGWELYKKFKEIFV
jgi:hypothetical protein